MSSHSVQSVIPLDDLERELAHWKIEAHYEFGRIELSGGQDDAREYFTELFRKNPKVEGAYIWRLAQRDSDIMDCIEERRAIRWVECGDDTIRGAIMCNLTDLTA